MGKETAPGVRHLALVAGDLRKQGSGTGKENIEASLEALFCLFEAQLSLDIPVLSVHLFPSSLFSDSSYAREFSLAVSSWLSSARFRSFLHENKVKLTVLGKWYDLGDELVESVKSALESTAGFDTFFLNLCLNYDGQEEILDALRVISRMIVSGKMSEVSVTKELVKEHMASSYFIPPDIVLLPKAECSLQGLFLWDIAFSSLISLGCFVSELTAERVRAAIGNWPCRG